MQINEQAIKRLRESSISPEAFCKTMEQICEANNLFGSGDTQLTLDYQSAEVVVQPGDMIPFITIGLRQAVVVETEVEVEVEK